MVASRGIHKPHEHVPTEFKDTLDGLIRANVVESVDRPGYFRWKHNPATGKVFTDAEFGAVVSSLCSTTITAHAVRGARVALGFLFRAAPPPKPAKLVVAPVPPDLYSGLVSMLAAERNRRELLETELLNLRRRLGDNLPDGFKLGGTLPPEPEKSA